MTPDINNTAVVGVAGLPIYCENRNGVDCFRYYVLGAPTPDCLGGIDHPDDHDGDYVARTYGGTKNFGQDFTYEEVVAWIFETKEKNEQP